MNGTDEPGLGQLLRNGAVFGVLFFALILIFGADVLHGLYAALRFLGAR